MDEVLKVVCTYMPESVTDQCKEFVNTFEGVIIDAIEAALTPSEICILINLCRPVLPYDMSHDEMGKQNFNN